MRGGGLRGVTQMLRRRWAYLRGALDAGGPGCGGGLIGEEIQQITFQGSPYNA